MEKIWQAFYDEDTPKSIDYPDKLLFEFLDHSAELYPKKTSLIFLGEKVNYRRLKEWVDSLAAGLYGLGVRKGDRIVLFLPNCIQYVISFYGILKVGAVVVPCNPLLSKEELLYQVKQSRAKAIITLDMNALYPKVSKVEDKVGVANLIVSSLKSFLPFPKNVLFPLVKRNEISRIKKDVIWLEDILTKYKGVAHYQPELKQQDVAVIFYTAGTTGYPKPVALTHRNLVVNAVQCKEWFKVTENDIFLTSLPFFHSYALSTTLNTSMSCGATVVTTPTFELEQTLRLIDHYSPTFFVAVPPIFEQIISYPKLSKHDFSSLRFAVSGAASLLPASKAKFEGLTNAILIEGYGLTEASPVTHCQPRKGPQRGIGIPFPDTDCKIVDLKEDKILLPGEEGELCVRGPQVMAGYWEREEETKKVLKNGWFYTGDIAKMDSDGYFEIIGRKDDIITVFIAEDMDGVHIYPQEIEKVISQHPQVKEVGVVGIHSTLGDKVKAFVEKEGELTAEQVREFCKTKLADYKVPEEIEFVNELPQNIIGKVLRKELRKRG